MKPEEFIKEIEKKLYSVELKPEFINQGIVETIGDGIAHATGLSGVGFGEVVEFEDKTKGLILNMDEDFVYIALLSDSKEIKQGTKVISIGEVLSVNASENLLGRVVDPLLKPLDGRDLKKSGVLYPLEKIAPGVIDRAPVSIPLKTGIKIIDSLIPIGRGQRELILGDRNTGKTTLALDTILNQKKRDLGLKKVICIYCAIGQKMSSVVRFVSKIEEAGAADYTIVVSSTASDPATVQYIAPFSACAIGEYFMDKGFDVLVVYDDLTKHAWAYRQLSLLIKRPAGREAYPGDIFYLHSRLLERAANLSNEKGGGSLTALPIVETQANDSSAYIPSNIISITDGQIFLETDLFNAGIRPAVNIGLSVSRVGGAAQTKMMKQFAGPLRLELAQFFELQAFVQFGSDLDEATTKKIERGKKLLEILKQPQYQPYDEISEILIVFTASTELLDDIQVSKIKEFEERLLHFLNLEKKDLLNKIKNEEKMDEQTISELKETIEKFKKDNFIHG